MFRETQVMVYSPRENYFYISRSDGRGSSSNGGLPNERIESQ